MANPFREAELTNTCKVNSTAFTIPPNETVEGIAIAYGSLVLMSPLSIVIGAFRSVSYLQKQKELERDLRFTGDWTCAITFGLFHYYQICKEGPYNESRNLPHTVLLYWIAIIALTPLLSHVAAQLLPGSANKKFIFQLNYSELLCMSISTIICVWYLLKKHWIAHDLIGFAFAVRGIELLQWTNFVTGYRVLGCLSALSFVVYWIGTNVPPLAFTSSSAPFTQLFFPMDLLENGLDANNFVLIGCGNILFPGIFIALILRFDDSLNRGTNFYFNGTLVAYLFGLATSPLMKHLYGFYFPALHLLPL